MARKRILVIGGGLAGLSTACYGLVNGWDVTVFEHGLALGGVCTAWRRGPYLVDGCIHWLTGGPFTRIYEELRIVPPVEVRPLREFATVRHVREGWSVSVGAELDALRHELVALAPGDTAEIDRILEAARHGADMSPGIERPQELSSLRERLHDLWGLRSELGTLVHFRGSVAEWTRTHLHSEALRTVLQRIVPPEGPMLFVAMILGYLARGWLSRPVGGTERFRDALVARFDTLGGQARLDATVDEILVRDDVAYGVRLGDGTIAEGDIVVSTASAPETVLRLLGGRYGAEALESRLARWKTFDPICLLSVGVAQPLTGLPSTLILDGIDAGEIAGRTPPYLYLRIYNEDPAFAPPGHCVVQLMLGSEYDWWARRGARYHAAKAEVTDCALALLAEHVPGIPDDVRMTDLATPLTYWRSARSWRGAFEGWMPSTDNFMRHVPKTLPGLDAFYMAGQWVEPGGGVPLALMSGRQLVQILCDAAGRPFLHTT
jgi:phytoene dehydrogenase-like protein